MPLISLELAIGEANVLRQLIDAAVRARGMEAAQVALVLDDKIAKAIAEAQKAADMGASKP